MDVKSTKTLSATVLSIALLAHSVVQIASDTVHFTNSRSRVEKSLKALRNDVPTKTYRLEVPGSQPITIIEAEPQHHTSDDKTTKDFLVPGSTHEKDLHDSKRAESGRCLGPSCHELVSNKKTVYSPDLLNKFLKEYADRFKNADEKTKLQLQQIQQQIEDESYVPMNDKSYQKNKISEKIDLHLQTHNSEASQWDRSDPKRNKHPYDDDDGWVTLEAVPWSRSKISKWKANSYKINKPSNTYMYGDEDRDPSINTDRFSLPGYGKPDLEADNTRPFDFERPINRPDPMDYGSNYGSNHGSNYGSNHGSNYGSNHGSNYGSNHGSSYGSNHGSNHGSNYGSSQQDSDWSNEQPSRPSWARPPHHSNSDHNNCNHEDHHIAVDVNRRFSNKYQTNDGIITDGQADEFPSYSESNFKRPTQALHANSKHPSTHPSNGDGEWVLLSTTKGYQLPKKRQRALSIQPHTISAHKSIKLTVLPAVDGSKENMTTSHGGMLEVEPSFHTVEESRKIQENEALKKNGTRYKRVKIRNVMTTDSGHDSSAVIAAVGAGLVPATVAMIMPMVLGRKRRSINRNDFHHLPVNQNVTQFPHLAYESTLQRNL